MTASVTCFISAKGGSGKTVTASALGTLLAALGFRVLMIDTDAATNGMTLLYLEQLLGKRRETKQSSSAGFGLFDADQEHPPQYVEIIENLHFVPATFRMGDTEESNHAQFGSTLSSAVRGARGSYDFVFLDAQAGADFFARVSADVADQAVIVSEYDPVSAQGIDRLKIMFATVIDPASTSTLFNKVLPEFAESIGDGLAVARYLPPLPWDADVVKAFAKRDLAINMQVPNAYTLAVAQLAYALFPDVAATEIERWQKGALAASTTPIESRLSELRLAEKELISLMKKRDLRLRFVGSAFAAASVFTFLLAAGFTIEWRRVLDYVMGESSVAVLAAGLVAVAIPGITTLLSDLFTRSFGSRGTEEKSIQILRNEREKVETILESTKSALKFTAPGYYEDRRRAQKAREDRAVKY